MAYIPKQKKKSYQRKAKKKFGQDPFYKKTVWRKMSKAIIEQFIICPVCEENPAEMTDHVIRRNQDGADYDIDNLLPMCNRCHNIKRGLEANSNDYLIETKESNTELDKVVPVDKLDIISVINKRKNRNKSYE